MLTAGGVTATGDTQRSEVQERACWLPGPHGPLSVRLHQSGSAVRAVALLCPPLAREHLATYPTYRRLADELARIGVLAARLDYAGTGDSSLSQHEPRAVERWLASVRAASAALARLGAPVVVVGMRMGALLAATALAVGADGPPAGQEVDLLVLWDPVASGRSFLREQRALRLTGVGADEGGPDRPAGPEVVELPSFSWSAAEAAEVSALTLAEVRGRLAREVVVLARPDRRLDQAVQGRMAGEQVHWLTAERQEDLLVLTTLEARVPERTLGELVVRLDALLPSARVEVGHVGADRTLVAPGVVELHVRLGEVGLVGVLTEPSERLAGSPTIMLLGNSNEPHVGPAREWVELARCWASHGLRVARLSVSGLGDSPVRPGQTEQVVYAPEALEDVVQAVRALEPDDPHQVVLVGMCSGAYQAVEAALEVGARGVVAINLIPGFTPPEAMAGRIDPRRRAVRPINQRVRRLGHDPRLWALARGLPGWVWWLADRIGVLPSPATPLRHLAAAQTRVLMLVGPHDARAYTTFAGATLRRLTHRGQLTFQVVQGMDHGMFRAVPRVEAVAAAREFVLRQWGAPPKP